MIEKYRSEIERISKIPLPVSQFWIDTILYEYDFGTKETALNILKRALPISAQCSINAEIQNFPLFSTKFFKILKNTDQLQNTTLSEKEDVENLKAPRKSPISCFYPKTEIEALKKSQKFSFHKTIIFYITQNIKCNHRILQKLFNSCKYFFAVQPTPICYRLVLGWREASKYIEQSLFLNIKDLDFPGLDNLYITTTLDILTYGSHRNILSNAIPRFYKCEAKYGHIEEQHITMDEFKFLYNGLPPIGNMIPWDVKIIHKGKTLDAEDHLWNINFLKDNIVENSS
uniref:Uncharacterized protein n=1 Tax=Panagrolaimus superbus TaxID=310955 RepID=A0A914ZDA7_9BILA